jgi:hypothetical protein
MKEMNMKVWLESKAYEDQKAVIAAEVNSLRATGTYAPITNASPNRTMHIDYAAFKQTKDEKEKAYSAKRNHKEILQKYFGSEANRHLNIPDKKLESSVKMSF